MAISGFRAAINQDQATPQTYMQLLDNPPISSPTYFDVHWPYLIMPDTTGGFDTNTGIWTAPAPGWFLTGWQVWVRDNARTISVSKLIFNGGGWLDTSAIGDTGLIPGTSTQPTSMLYRVAQGDTAKIQNYSLPVDPSKPIAIDALSQHTYWWGMFFPD